MCSTDDPKKTEHLLALDGSFDSVVDGCEGVFHTASPFYHKVTDPQVHSFSLKLDIANFM